MRLSIALALGALVVVSLILTALGLSFAWAAFAGILAAAAGFATGMKLFVDKQHHGQTKSSVLRNAFVQVNALQQCSLAEFQKSVAELRYDQGLAKSAQGSPIEEEITNHLPDDELEETRVLSGDGSEPGPDVDTPSGIMYESDYPPNSRFFVIDITVQPTEKSTGGHTHYEPDALEIVPAPDPGSEPRSDSKKHPAPTPHARESTTSIVGIEVHDGARFLPTQEKLTGQQRLRIHLVVTDTRAKKLRLSYYFEQFGELNLPA